jgi:hypothetical protein
MVADSSEGHVYYRLFIGFRISVTLSIGDAPVSKEDKYVFEAARWPMNG